MTYDRMKITAAEQAERARNIGATDSASPSSYVALVPDSSLVTVAGHDAQYGDGRRYGMSVRGIILHTTEGDSFASSMRYNARRPQTVSATYHVGQNGEIGQGVPEADRPWTTGRWNDETISVEINGRAADTAAEWFSRPDQLASLTNLLVDLCRRHQITPEWLTSDQWAQGASKQSTKPYTQGSRDGIIDHDGANQAAIKLGGSPAQYSHYDIGAGLRSIVVARIIPDVEMILDGLNPDPPPPDPIQPPEDDMNTAIIWSPRGYQNAFLVGAGIAHLSPPMFAHYAGLGVKQILQDDHAQTLATVLHATGLTPADLVRL